MSDLNYSNRVQETKRHLFDPEEQGKMKAAVFMSGMGSNFKRLYSVQKNLENIICEKTPFEIVAVITDNSNAYENAKKIVKDISKDEKRISYISLNFGEMSEEKNRENFLKKLDNCKVNFGFLLGFMKILPPWLIEKIPCINIHPSPLNILDPNTNKRKYVGSDAVKQQILEEEEYLQATAHFVRKKVDSGEILMLSDELKVNLDGYKLENIKKNSNLLENIVKKNQESLKEKGDHIIIPKTVLLTALGKYYLNKFGELCCKNETNIGEKKQEYFDKILNNEGILSKYL